MLKKMYGKTGEELSIIGFGGMRFDNPEDIDANAEIVLYAHEKGVSYFDTAPGYCGDKSEDIMGAAIKQMKPGSFSISTKCSAAEGDKVRQSIERSVERLNVDTIDFFHIWCVMSREAWEGRKAGGAVEAAAKAKEEGLVKHVVMSSHMPGGELAGVLEEGLVEGVTLGYCAINFPMRQEAIHAAGRLGLGVVTMNPLGGGVIPQNAERFDFIRDEHDESVVAAALRFNLSNPAVTTALVGFTTREHVDQAVNAVADFQPHGAEHLQAIRKRIEDSFSDLCTGCGYCLPCPVEIAIPKMMDAYNMKMLNNDDNQQIVNRLKWHWSLPAEMAGTCTQCGECEERCTQHLPIRERLEEIAALG